MWTPSLCPQVWVESWSLEQERGVEWYGMREHEEVTHMQVGAFLEGHHSLSNGRSRALCLIILHKVHLKQYLHMSVQFNIWVTPSSQLQNTPQHGCSGQPIMQHVTKVVGSILEHRTIIRGK